MNTEVDVPVFGNPERSGIAMVDLGMMTKAKF
jgi:hypothetical protein